MRVAVLGASDDPERYSYKALVRLKEAGHTVYPVHPRLKTIEGVPVFASLKDIPEPIHTLTLYVSPEVSSKMEGEILASKPGRLIFNPGAENSTLMAKAAAQGIRVLEACTLVLLSTDQFGRA